MLPESTVERGTNAAADEPRTPVLQPHSDSERRRLADRVPPTDDAPTVISARRADHPLDRGAAELRGRKLGHFELIEPIGVGGMAAVLRARDVNLDRVVALKILPPEAAADPEYVTRFHAEARAAAKLDHENIARVYYGGSDQDLHFIAFEFVEGETLRAVLERQGPLPTPLAVQTMLQIATGLAHAATRGVVHRDIKPSNIIITPEGRAKIVDMGLARFTDAAADQLTQSGVTLGTFDYISPEQAIEPRSADVRSDIYSLGCTFYHALTGQPPVPGGTAAKKLHHHQNIAPVDPRHYNPAIPEAVVAVLSRMMAKEPSERYQPELLVHDLRVLNQRWNGNGETTGRSAEPLWANRVMPRTPARRGRLLAAFAVLAVVALVAVQEATRPRFDPPPGRSLGQWFARPSEGPNDAANGNGGATGPAAFPVSPSAAVPQPPPANRAEPIYRVETVEQLRELFRRDLTTLHVQFAGPGPFVLTPADADDEAGGLTFTGRKLVLETLDPTRLTVIRFECGPMPDHQQTAALAVTPKDMAGSSVILKGLRWECRSEGTIELAAVHVTGADRVEIERCAFVLNDAGGSGRGCGSVVLARGDNPGTPSARIANTLFGRGSQAIQLLGPANVNAVQCAFGPHSHAVVRLRETGGLDQTTVRLEHCTTLQDNGPVIWADDAAGGSVSAGHCLFTRPGASSVEDAGSSAVLVRQTGAHAGVLQFKSHLGIEGVNQRNGYYNLAGFWSDETASSGPRLAVTLDDARRLPPGGREDDATPRPPRFADADALELPGHPFQESRPLERLIPALAPGAASETAREAFAIHLRMPFLRVPGVPQTEVLGVMFNVWGASYTLPLAPFQRGGEGFITRLKVVDPLAAPIDSVRNIYSSLAHAVLESRAGDVILIKQNGRIEVEPVRLERPDVKLVVRPFPRYHPILTVTPASAESEVALFRLIDGELRLEGLEIALRPARPEYRAQSVVTLAGPGECVLDQCVVTLEEADGVELALARVLDYDSLRDSHEKKPSPRLRAHQCFVRGVGDLLESRTSKPLAFELDHSLVALDGSLITAFCPSRDTPPGTHAIVRLTQSSILLSRQLLGLRASTEGKPASWPAFQVQAESSVLAAAARQPLLLLEGVDSEDRARQLIAWKSDHTRYANLGGIVLEATPPGAERAGPGFSWDLARWHEFASPNDRSTGFNRLRWSAAPQAPERPWSRTRPGDFRIRWLDAGSENPGTPEPGANLESLPQPLPD